MDHNQYMHLALNEAEKAGQIDEVPVGAVLVAKNGDVLASAYNQVIHENDPADSLFVIESGKDKVYCSDKNGKEFIMNTQGAGDYFGELALLDDSTRSASVRTVEKCSFCIIYKEDFNRVLDEHPNIGRQLEVA